jgi:hypothetical protein
MKSGLANLALCAALVGATSAFAATPPKPVGVDRSASFLIDEATAEKLWKDNTSARVLKLYPTRKFRFVSEVGGGFNEAKLCVISARAMLLPMKGSAVVYSPIKAATAFDAVANLSREQCQELARNKLVEAIQSVEAALVAS